jgi:8-oxo-dGTP pyrophosphatase MutT (NUDIX family)
MHDVARKSSRVILLNERQEVLLIKFVAERDHGPFALWATPTGEVEPNETDLHAARRELREELRLSVDLTGPVHSPTSDFEQKERVSATPIPSISDIFSFSNRSSSPSHLRLKPTGAADVPSALNTRFKGSIGTS